MNLKIKFLAILLSISCGSSVPQATLKPPKETCSADINEADFNKYVTSTHAICNDCIRMFPIANCGKSVIELGSCVTDPTISYYKIFDTVNSTTDSYWYKNSVLLYGRQEQQGAIFCQSEGNPPCGAKDFNIAIVWCQ